MRLFADWSIAEWVMTWSVDWWIACLTERFGWLILGVLLATVLASTDLYLRFGWLAVVLLRCIWVWLMPFITGKVFVRILSKPTWEQYISIEQTKQQKWTNPAQQKIRQNPNIITQLINALQTIIDRNTNQAIKQPIKRPASHAPADDEHVVVWGPTVVIFFDNILCKGVGVCIGLESSFKVVLPKSPDRIRILSVVVDWAVNYIVCSSIRSYCWTRAPCARGN